MNEKTFETLKNLIYSYQESKDTKIFNKILKLHYCKINEYIINYKCDELENDEVLTIIVLTIKKYIENVNPEITFENYLKNLKRSIRKSVYKEAIKYKNRYESYELYASKHKNGEDNSYEYMDKLTYENIDINEFVDKLPIGEKSLIRMKYGFDGIRFDNVQLAKIYETTVPVIKEEEQKILVKLRKQITQKLKD